MNRFVRLNFGILLLMAAAGSVRMPIMRGATNPATAEKSAENKTSAAPNASGGNTVAENARASRESYDDSIRAHYSFPFVKDNLSLPGNAEIEGNQFLPASAYPDAEYCGHCHKEAYHQWRQSLHANSFRTPFYRNSVNILLHTKGPEYARHCDSCHTPIGIFAGAVNPVDTMDRSFDHDGLTCMTCHSIQAISSREGNGSYVMGVPAVMVDANGKRIPGRVPDAEILAHLDRHSKAVMQPLYHRAEFCAACHKASFPPMLNDYKWLRAFSAFDEWQNSKFSQENPLTFYPADRTTCQGCHMKRAATTLPEPGAKKGTFVSHRWTAGNTAVPFYYGYDEQLQKTIDFLRSGNYLNVDIFGLRIHSVQASAETADKHQVIDAGTDDLMHLAAPLGTSDFTLPDGRVVDAWVVIQNRFMGHSLIPEVRDLYQAWVEFSVTDTAGRELFHSGFLRPDKSLDPSAHSFTNRPVDVTGSFVDNHKVWAIHSNAYDNSIQPGSSTLVRYRFQIPPGLKGTLRITARVNYRHLRQSYLNNVFGKDHPDYPIVVLASETRTLKIGENQPAPATALENETENEDWMRWNNLGIALLDQLQYPQAEVAFEKVLALRPDYKDGYVNLSLTYIDWEKYAQARAPLEKALALHPDDARALYYLALVERRQRHSEAEVADLQKVVAQFPECRDARRELGISYYQQHRSEEAIAQFKALQSIDPDDLAAHYNLSILYRRKGLKQLAQQEAAQYTMKRIDPGAPTYSLDYLRKHPELSIESDPWHIHTSGALAIPTALHTATSCGPQQPEEGTKP
uniref:Cytochrome c-552/4 domain-containing protein n=1 Tax=mine drainage metagenome TaxID=410659 RepID=E6PXE6_9ZZZZ